MIVERIYDRKLQDFSRHKKEENVFYVTDLVRCPLKVRFEKQYKELSDSFTPAAVMGDLVHSGLEQFLKEEFDAEVEVDVEKEVSIDGKIIKVRGRADAVIQEDGERVVVEIKSSRADKGLPFEHHRTQLQVYLWMFEARRGILIYVTPDRITEYEVDEPLDEATVLNLLVEVIRASRAPRYFWECNYCKFNVICPNKRQ